MLYRRGYQCFRLALRHRKHLLLRQIVMLQHHTLIRVRFAQHRVLLRWRKHWLNREKPGTKFIGVVLTERFGDIVACEPVVRYLRRQYPDAYIVWFVRKPYRELLESHPGLDLVVLVQCLNEAILIRKGNLFDRFVNLHINGKMCSLCGTPTLNFDGNPEITPDNYHQHGSLLPVFCEGAGLPPLEDQPHIHISPTYVSRVDGLNLPSEYVAIHCVSEEASKNWRNDRWSELVMQLTEVMGVSVVEVGLKQAILSTSPQYHNFCGKISISETAEVIKRASTFVGVDSGPAHLANAVNTPGVILLGPYRGSKRFLPYTGMYADSSMTELLYADNGLDTLTVDEVYQAIRRQLINPSLGYFSIKLC